MGWIFTFAIVGHKISFPIYGDRTTFGYDSQYKYEVILADAIHSRLMDNKNSR